MQEVFLTVNHHRLGELVCLLQGTKEILLSLGQKEHILQLEIIGN